MTLHRKQSVPGQPDSATSRTVQTETVYSEAVTRARVTSRVRHHNEVLSCDVTGHDWSSSGVTVTAFRVNFESPADRLHPTFREVEH